VALRIRNGRGTGHYLLYDGHINVGRVEKRVQSWATSRSRTGNFTFTDWRLHMNGRDEVTTHVMRKTALWEAEMWLTAHKWNQAHPVGTVVKAWPGDRTDPPLRTVTRTPAWVLGGHTPVVSVDGYPGGIALTHVEVVNG
jgi:hypothetical protein